MEITLAQLAVRLGGTLIGGNADAVVTGIAGFDAVTDSQVTYLAHARHLAQVEATPALAVIVPRNVRRSSKPLIVVEQPRAAFGVALGLFDWRRPPLPGIDPSAVIASSAGVHAHAYVGPHASVGEYSFIGAGSAIHAQAVIGDHVEIGRDVIIHPHVTIYARCVIGDRVVIHAGTIIGSDGLGYTIDEAGWVKMPHVGSVVIEEDVEIGANCTVDRATAGETRIGRGAKIDNLVHIAHNVKIGPGCLIQAQVGIAGSAVLEAGAIMAGQSGIADHQTIGSGGRVAMRGGVISPVPPGATVSGFPARDHAEQLRVQAAQRRLPELLRTVKELQQRLRALEEPK